MKRIPSLLTALFFLILFASNGYAIRTDSPSDNSKLRTEQSALLGAYIGATASGLVLPWPVGPIADVAAFGFDVGLKHVPPQFSVPSDANVYLSPNSEEACSYVYPNLFFQDEMSGLFGFVLERFERNTFTESLDFPAFWSVDPGNPVPTRGTSFLSTYHPNGEVRVRAINAFLNSNASDLSFPEGHHQIKWEADTRVNPIFDIALPAGLTAFGAFSSYKTASRIAQKKATIAARSADDVAKVGSRSNAQKLLDAAAIRKEKIFKFPIKVASKVGVYTGRRNSESFAEFYERTSYSGARNRDFQTINVWDTTIPYFEDRNELSPSFGSRIQAQNIVLEAQDFGGVRLNRVIDYLREQFEINHQCEPIIPQLTSNEIVFDNRVERNNDLARIFPIGEDSTLTWQARDSGPFAPNLNFTSGYTREGEAISFSLIQNIRVLDTQPPLITVPGGFAYESDAEIEFDEIADFIGRPRIVDLADPRPTFERTELDSLEPDHRYEIFWTARDSSNNVSEPELQLITIKTPGTNTAPTANSVDVDNSVTGEVVDILLTGEDLDEIDGRVDPLNFEITAPPSDGILESPLYPHFIQDYRLSPVGEQEDIQQNEVVRTSPLQHLAVRFAGQPDEDGRPGAFGVSNHGVFLRDEICNAQNNPEDDYETLNFETFNNVVPVNFVYQPRYVQVDDDGFYYIRDSFWRCDVQREAVHFDYRDGISPIPRISKWDSEGNFVAHQELIPIPGETYPFATISASRWPDDKFSFDEFGRIWITTESRYSFEPGILNPRPAIALGLRDYLYKDVTLLSLSSRFDGINFHGRVRVNYNSRLQGQENVGIAVDREREIYYDLRGWGFKPFDLENTDALSDDPGALGVDPDAPGITPDGYRLIPGCSNLSCYNSGSRSISYQHRAASDIDIDSEGNVYILHRYLSRIYKYAPPTFEEDTEEWIPGEFIGWMGRCDANLQNDQNEFFNACDEINHVSRGFACTDAKCSRDEAHGSLPGQFSLPEEVVIDDNDIFYVADTGNQRVQRFAQDGTFAGEATSSGQGFVLGNFESAQNLSVNSKGFYLLETDDGNFDYFLHVFKSLPFWDMTDSTATVRYRSEFGFIGDDQFSYLVDDGLAKSDPVDVTLQIERAYNAPIELTQECFAALPPTTEVACELDEDTEIYVRLTSMDRDGFLGAGGLDEHEYIIEADTQQGTLSIEEAYSSDNTIIYRYTPNADYYGSDSFSYYVVDEQTDSNLTLRSEATPEVVFNVAPIPDRMAIDVPDSIQVPRGFRHFIAFPYSDVDDQDHSEFVRLNWGDTTLSTQTNVYRVPFSGHFDIERREIEPPVDTASGSGLFLGSHIYTDESTDPLVIEMSNLDFDADTGDSEYTVESIPVEIVEVTQLAVESGLIKADPDQNFVLQFDIANLRPEGWAGNVAPNVRVEFEIPDGLNLSAVNSACSQTTRDTDDGSADFMTCSLGNMDPDQRLPVIFNASADLDVAREDLAFFLDIDIFDDTEKLVDNDFGQVIVEVNDRDEDGVLDVDDAFPDEASYSDDTDEDGLPDLWEERFGLDPNLASDASEDPDGDGRNNLSEFEAGNSPLAADNGAQLSTLASFQDVGDVGKDWFGFRVDSGDFNGDGNADLLASAPEMLNNRGEIRVFYGDGQGNFDRDFNGNLGQPDRFLGNGSGSFLGSEIAVGDFDGNGYDDIVWSLRPEGGGVEVEFSNQNGIRQSTSNINYRTTALLVADVDGDGLDDILTADSGYSESVANSGIVRVYLGADTVYTFEDTGPSMTIIGPADARIGDHLSVGDVDGDGDPDLIVGAQKASSSTGAVHIYLGSDNIWSPGGFGEPSKTLTGYVVGGLFGFNLAADADVDGDGIDDILVGAYGADRAHLFLSDSGYLNQGVPSVIDIVGDADSQLGVSVAFSESIVPDIFADAIIGGNRLSVDSTDEGHVKVYRGSADGLVEISEYRGGADSHFGYSVADLGDVNGDGRGEIAVGAPEITSGEEVPGQVQVLSISAELTDTDTDNDWVGDTLDNCVNEANTNQLDTDLDTQGDVCDPNDDNDTLADAEDNCPLNVNDDQLDTDGDGLGNVCDSDIDGDAIANVDDDFPLDSRYQTDTDGDGLPDGFEQENGFEENNPADALADADGDGLNNLAEYLEGGNPLVDDQAPVLTIPADISVNSTGSFTDVNIGQATAADGLDGIVSVNASSASPFVPGRHEIVWTAVDAAGNEVSASQFVDVTPQVSLTSNWQTVPEGKRIKVFAELNGDAVVYPVQVSIALSGTALEMVDFGLSDSMIEISQGQSASIELTTIEDGEDETDETIVFSISEVSNAVVSELASHLVTISEQNAVPYVFSDMRQSGDRRSIFLRDDGMVEVRITALDLDDADTLTITASAAGIELIGPQVFSNEEAPSIEEPPVEETSDVPGDEDSEDIPVSDDPRRLTPITLGWVYEFDPFVLEQGQYSFSYEVRDNGDPQNIVSVTHPFEIAINRPELLATNDSDNDGESDAGEGIVDSNQNGISDYLEALVGDLDNQNQIPGLTGERRPLQTEPQLRMRLGQTSMSSGSDAEVDFVDISLYGGTSDIAENVDDDQFTYPYGIFDFEVEGLRSDQRSVSVVIPLGNALPMFATYRKYLSDIGWQDFVVDEFNTITSAPGSARACPSPGDSSYEPGLNQGDYCIQLSIEDGGANDADMERNGKIVDPGGVAVELDEDADGFGNSIDNCPNMANSDQADADDDGLGNVCDDTPNGNSGNQGSGGGGSSSGGSGGGGSADYILLAILMVFAAQILYLRRKTYSKRKFG